MTNLNIAKLYLATNATATAAQIDAAITDGSAATAVTALTGTTLLNAKYGGQTPLCYIFIFIFYFSIFYFSIFSI